MTSIEEFERPEDRIFLTADFDNFNDLRYLQRDVGDRIHAVKLGQSFVRHDRSRSIHAHLNRMGMRTFIDLKLNEDPDQMGYVVSQYVADDYSYLSIAGSASPEAMREAFRCRSAARIVVAFSVGQPRFLELELDNVSEANDNLPETDRIDAIMCNVGDISRVRKSGSFAVIATGIRMPGDTVHDQPMVMTPYEALAAGADYLAVGRAVTAYSDRHARMDAILRDIE
jgi:orotidine-5'-phosphate decarboxylase